MAHRILGIDLGTWSVKVAELEAGFRQSRLVGLYERPLLPPPPGEESGEDELLRAARTAGALIADERLSPEMVSTSMRGEATLRLVALPFADPKKIEQVLGYELESLILGDLDGLVIDNVVASTRSDGASVLAVAAERERVRAVIAALAGVGAEPRLVGSSALSYAALRDRAFSGDPQPQLIVDFGHRNTHVCVVAGERITFARTIGRGAEDVTNAISDGFKMAPADAESAKHAQAFLLAPGEIAATPQHRRVDECVREAVRPLVRELRQTVAAYRAAGEGPPVKLLYTGGGAKLRGLPEHISVELGLPVEPLALIEGPFVAPELNAPAGPLIAAQALGLALAEATPLPQVNLRKGELAYRTDYSYLRGKAGYLMAAVLTILAFAGANAVASLKALHKEADVLEARLKKETVELFGEARLDGKAVSEELRAGPRGGPPPFPTMTAYDVLDEISRHVPAGDKTKLDVLELEIKPKKTFIKATAESAQQVDDLVEALKGVDCFEDIQKGKLSSVTAPPSGDNPKGEKASEMKQFTLTITHSCL
jgi:general secretion pathway protein L